MKVSGKKANYIRVVLVQPTHPGNIGATARAMANMGVSELALVQPRDFPGAEASARAAGADAILEHALVVDDLDQAIADCALVVGASARSRSIEWPQLSPAQAMEKVAETARHAPVALLFGRESRGLTNRELERCHYLVRIPSEPAFPSLNIASAAMVLLYELRCVMERDQANHDTPEASEPLADGREMQHFYQHLQQLLTRLQFADGNADKLHRKLTRLFNRARPYAREIRILRGILSTVEEKIRD